MKRAFTLIELLVVIAIVSLLASIILGSLNGARTKASNAKISQNILQYFNALELIRSKYGAYPTTTGNAEMCLGDYSANWCGASPAPTYEDVVGSQLVTRLKEFTPSLPPVGPIIPAGYSTYTVAGATYQSNSTGATSTVIWALEGKNQTCARGATPLSTYKGLNISLTNITVCQANLQ